ncbi:hypothetical protein DL769_009799 [Monosporascus sp. CRB-8-3]|nr:hypothetical protein DL769_009799 [Monosporascus sp. CRB-8-3]
MDSMDLDIDMDLDVDLVPDEPIVPELAAEELPGDRSDGEVAEEPDVLAPTKVHIRGLDVLKPDDVKAYVAEHFPESPFEKIEWIDDSSANLIFPLEPVAARALEALAVEPIEDVALLPARQLLPAKRYSQMPDIALQVRLAVLSDKKQAGAAQRSRFYLLNPEYDPEERRRRSEARRYRDRAGSGYGRGRGRDFRDEEPTEPFDVNLYDDDEASRANRAARPRRFRRRSCTPESDRSEPFRNENRGKELFPEGSGNRHASRRDRSASPMRDRDGDRSMDDMSSDRPAARNRDRARAIKNGMSRSDRSRELFPQKLKSGNGRLGDAVEDAADLMAKGITLPLMDGSSDVKTSTRGRRLEDRITVPGKGKLADRISSPGEAADGGSAFSIRGSANQKSADQGFTIKGVAGKSVKELFPDKFGGNSGKELFADRLEGRTRRRQRAGDLFD